MNKISFNNWTPVCTGLICLCLILLLIFPLSVFSWDGFDYDAGNYIEIDDPDISSLAPGTIIQIYDDEDSNYHAAEIMSVVRTLNETNIEAFDQDTDEYRTFEMERIKVERSLQ
jgi:hypothetical protein